MSSLPVVSSNAGPVTIPGESAPNAWTSTAVVLNRVKAIDKLMREVLHEGITQDYGKIPGMPAGAPPCLFKSGSEKILAMFQIAVDPIVEDLSTDDCFRYRVITRMTYVPTGQYLGSGIGEASSNETKYKWKRTYSKKEFEETDPDRRRLKWKSYQGEETAEYQIRQEPADVANTVLKIAKKRSQIDGTLTVTGASSMFSQDLEDLEEGTVQVDEQPQQRGKRGRARKQEVEDVKCGDCGEVNKHAANCKWHPEVRAAAMKAQREQREQDANPKPQQAPAGGNEKLLCVLKSASKRPTSTGGEVYELHVMVDGNPDLVLYCFHIEACTIMIGHAIGKPCIFKTRVRQTTVGARIQVDEILEAGGVPYQNNRPTQGTVVTVAPKAEEPW